MALTPLMNLDLPVVGPSGTAGPDWANDLNEALTLVDSHDHSDGKGTQITPSGLNINADLPLGTSSAPNNLTFTRSVRFRSQGASLATSSDVSCVYVANGDLYYNNSSGVVVQLTSGSGINLSSVGSIGGDYSTTPGASVTYSNATKLYLFKQTAAITADIAGGSLFIYENVASGKYTKLKVPTGLATNIDLTLFATLPSTTLPVSVSSTGTLSAATITTAQITDNAVTRSKLESVGQQISASCSAWGSTSTTFVDVTNLSVTITTTGRPVYVGLIPDGSAGPSEDSRIDIERGGSTCLAKIQILRDATSISKHSIASASNGSTSVATGVPVGCIHHIDTPAAGTYTYKVQASTVFSSSLINVNFAKLIAYEL